MQKSFRLATIIGSLYFIQTKSLNSSNQPPYSMILRGQYQNKIRRYSSPQKIFDVFASISQSGTLFMNKRDLLKAICFFNYSITDDDNIKNFKPKHIFQLMGKQDRFEIYDYFILVRYLAYDRWKLKKYMDEKELVEMTPQQYQQLMINEICGDYNKFIKTNILLQSRQFKPSQEAYRKSVKETINGLFHGKETLTYVQLAKFRWRILRQLFQFEFLSFPGSQDNHIDGVDFARSIIKYIDSKKRKSYMRRIKDSQQMQKIQISRDSYIGFHLFMQTHLQQLRKILSSKGALSSQDITNIVNQYTTRKQYVSKPQINILMLLLDTDNSGFIQKRQLLGVLKHLEYYTTVKSGQTTLTDLIIKDWQDIKEKLIKIKDVLQS